MSSFGRLPRLAQPGSQDLTRGVLSARDASELISVTHPAMARQMQRVAAQLVGALQLIAGMHEQQPR